MGNLANLLCGGTECEPRTIERLTKLERTCNSQKVDNETMKKKVADFISWKMKVEEERRSLMEKCEDQNSTITEMKRLIEKKDEELRERMKISENKTQELMYMEKEINNLEIRIKEYREENIFQNEQVQVLGIMEFKMASLESEREDILAENEALDNEIGMMEKENEDLKVILRKIHEQQKQSLNKSTSSLYQVSCPSSPFPIRN